MEFKDPWKKTRQRVALFFIFIGWILFAMVIYQISLFDYEMANFDPYEILGVSLDADKKTIKSQYKKMSLIYHPDKPTGNEKLFMKLRKAYDALTGKFIYKKTSQNLRGCASVRVSPSLLSQMCYFCFVPKSCLVKRR